MTKMLIDRSTVEQALEALDLIADAMPFPVAQKSRAALRAALAAPTVVEPNPWREAVIDRLVVLWNLTGDNENDPRRALADIERMVEIMALDPCISSEAQALIDRGRAEATPPRAALTDEEIMDAVRESDLDWQTGWSLDEDASNRYITFARAIERAHGVGVPRNE